MNYLIVNLKTGGKICLILPPVFLYINRNNKYKNKEVIK